MNVWIHIQLKDLFGWSQNSSAHLCLLGRAAAGRQPTVREAWANRIGILHFCLILLSFKQVSVLLYNSRISAGSFQEQTMYDRVRLHQIQKNNIFNEILIFLFSSNRSKSYETRQNIWASCSQALCKSDTTTIPEGRGLGTAPPLGPWVLVSFLHSFFFFCSSD